MELPTYAARASELRILDLLETLRGPLELLGRGVIHPLGVL